MAPKFVADPEAATKLGDETEIAGRRLRIPRGWVVHANDPLERGQTVVWKDPNARRDDGTAPQLQITVVPLTQAEINELGWKPKETLDKAVDVETRDLENVKRMPAETGYINDAHGVRARWQGVNPRTKRNVHGVVYVFFDNLQLVIMATGLSEPEHESAIKLAEASFLSLRRP